MNIAIFGGSFNPVHREHESLARAAVEHLKLDKLIIMPTFISPHKSDKLCADPQSRLAMCKAAFSSVPNAEVSDFEIQRGGVSYSYVTCQHFAELYPTANRYFIMGADMLKSFPSWRNPDIICKYFSLAACTREGDGDFGKYISDAQRLCGANVFTVPYSGGSVSSTRIRTLAALGEDFSEYVSDDICRYINVEKLYLIKKLLPVKKMMKKQRWEHSVRVAVMCARNASRIGLDEKSAIVMGALHDCAKYLTADSPCLKGFEFPQGVPEPVMHQFTGAYVAEHTFGVNDPAILDAIRYHTTGRAAMTDTGILLYLCDMLEEGRNFDGVEELRALFYRDMHLCIKQALKMQTEHLMAEQKPVDSLTLTANSYYNP